MSAPRHYTELQRRVVDAIRAHDGDAELVAIELRGALTPREVEALARSIGFGLWRMTRGAVYRSTTPGASTPTPSAPTRAAEAAQRATIPPRYSTPSEVYKRRHDATTRGRP